ncbi:permease [Bdellovibrio bacteriovorus]|uniref:Permease n=2 Tax=Bdellovibrio bacteriovorus TaxID=959 RepID=A0A150WGZ8_BDEBC|nr:permease [Bdellovibrio bacteriovorus]
MYQAGSNQTSRSPKLLSGILMILIGSSSYGMLSTFVKLAYKHGHTTAEVTVAQFGWGVLILTLLAMFFSKNAPKPSKSEYIQLVAAGTTLGFTSVLYYLSVQYIAASVAVVLLMQSIWLGVLFESIIKKTWPSLDKIIAVVLVLFGTVLATNALDASAGHLDIRGFFFGMLAAISFSGTMAATGSIASHLPPIKRSQIMLYGGALVVLIFAIVTQIAPYYWGVKILSPEFTSSKSFDFSIFLTYGLFVAIFGTVLPPIMLNKGFPITGVGLGSIISSIELPFAMMIAFILLGEHIGPAQLVGVAIIIISVFILNYRMVLNETQA